MAPLKLCLLSMVLLIVSNFGDAVMNERFGLNPRHTVVIDRFASNHESPGYFILPLDKTAFSVDKPLWLHQFDIPKVYLYDPINEIAVDNLPIRLRFVKIANQTFPNDNPAEVIFIGRTIVNSTHETTVKVPAKVPLHPGFMYEIRLKMPEKTHLMYNEFHDIRDYKINRFFGKSITVSFYQHNPMVKPPNPSDKRRKVSHGLVKKLHLKYSWF